VHGVAADDRLVAFVGKVIDDGPVNLVYAARP